MPNFRVAIWAFVLGDMFLGAVCLPLNQSSWQYGALVALAVVHYIVSVMFFIVAAETGEFQK